MNSRDDPVSLSLCQEVPIYVDEYLGPKTCKEDQKSIDQASIQSFHQLLRT